MPDRPRMSSSVLPSFTCKWALSGWRKLRILQQEFGDSSRYYWTNLDNKCRRCIDCMVQSNTNSSPDSVVPNSTLTHITCSQT